MKSDFEAARRKPLRHAGAPRPSQMRARWERFKAVQLKRLKVYRAHCANGSGGARKYTARLRKLEHL